MRRQSRLILSLRWQFVLLLLLATLPAAVYTVYSAWTERQSKIAQALQNANRLALAASAVHREVLQGSRHLLEGLAVTPSIRMFEEPRCSEILADVLARFRQYEMLAAIDADGETRCASHDGSVPASLTGRSWFERVRTTREFTIGEYAIGTVSKLPVVVAAVPILDQDGGFAGAMLATISLDWLERLTVDIEMPDDSFIVLLDPEGNVIARYPADPDIGRTLPPPGELETLLRMNSTGFSGTDIGGRERFFGVAALQDTGVKLVVSLPEAVARSEAQRSFWHQLAGLIGVWLLALAAAWFGVEFLITRWLRSLSSAAAAISAGDLSARPAIPRTRSELRQLAKTFSLMASRIRTREANLRHALEEREVLIREIHHRVKNNLQVITSLLNLQMQSIESPELRQRLEEAQARIRALSLVHNRLYAGNDLSSVDLRQLFLDLIAHLFEIHGITNGRVRSAVDVPPWRISMDCAIPLALLTTEAVMNSLKYAFPGDRAGTIRISVDEGDGEIVLRIADDGVGLGEAVETLTARGSLGLRLIQALAGQLSARLDIRSENGVTIGLVMERRRFLS